MPEPISDELLGVDLGDKRLNRRRQVLQALSVNPQASMNGAFEKWGDTLAAYQLLRKAAVTPEAILKPHYASTLARINEHPVVSSSARYNQARFHEALSRMRGVSTRPIEDSTGMSDCTVSKTHGQGTLGLHRYWGNRWLESWRLPLRYAR